MILMIVNGLFYFKRIIQVSIDSVLSQNLEYIEFSFKPCIKKGVKIPTSSEIIMFEN